MKSLAKICLALVTALALSAVTAHAQTDSTTSTNTAPAAKPRPKTKGYAGKIASVDNDAKTITFTLPGGTTHTVKITSKTRIKKDGEAATLSDAAVGLHISGRYRENDAGDWIATTANIGETKKKAKDASTTTPTPPAKSDSQ